MKIKKLVLPTFALLLTNISFANDTKKETAPAKDVPVAIVNGTPIMKSYFLQTYQQNLLYVGTDSVTKEKVLNDLINRQLGIEKAKKANIANDAIVKPKLEDVMFHAQISKDLEGKLAKITVSDDEVKSYYSKNKEYHTAHILLRLPVDAPKEQQQAALDQALKIFDDAQKNPGKFSELADKYSQATNASSGGDLGFQPAIKLAPEYFRAVDGKESGSILPVVKTQFGYHIIKVLGVKKFEEIAMPFYKKVVYDTKRDQIIDLYFKDMRTKAQIKINKENI